MANLKFDFGPKEIEEISERAKSELLANLNTLGQIKASEATFQNTVVAFEKLSTDFSSVITPIQFLKYVATDPIVRQAADKCETSVQQMFVDIYAREDLFRVIKAGSENSKSLTTGEKLLTEEYLTTFRRNGLELSGEMRKLYSEKKKQLVSLESEFANNLLNENDFLPLKFEELNGLPATYINALEKTSDGCYKLSMSYPHYYPFMQNAKSAEARKQYEFKFNNRGGEKNRKLLEQAIVLRHELAQLLGFKNHAAYVLDRRMAKTPETAQKFLSELVSRLKQKGIENIKEMIEVKKTDLGTHSNCLHSWEWRYYENLLKKTKYQVDTQLLKEYFPVEVVLKGMFEIYQSLFSVHFELELDASVWHPSVKKYRIVKQGETVAFFYMDLYPREGKYGHAAAFTLASGHQRNDDTYELPISAIVANFNPPTATDPSLLPHSDVETLFHEFGHIMHQTLTRARFATFSGTNVKTDFVEAPSQMLENWVWRKESLKMLSGHYKDHSQKLPDALIEKLIVSKMLNVGVQNLRQLAFAMIDLDFHVSAHANTTEVYERRMAEIMLIPIQPGTHPQSGFGHLMGGYDAGYYGYMWAKVYAQEMFTRFDKEGLLNPKTGSEYLQCILQPGGEAEPFELISKFLGRPPTNEAFLHSMGL